MVNRAEGETEQLELVKKTSVTSIIWTWFGYKPSDEQQERILCRVCGATVLAKSSNTTNLFYHLKTKHAIEYPDIPSLPKVPGVSRILIASP